MKTPPHNLEAERSILGAILLHPGSIHEAMDFLVSNDFYVEAHRHIFYEMVQMAFWEPIEITNLQKWLTRSGKLDAAGGAAYLAALIDGVPRASNVKDYARIVQDKAEIRALLARADQLLAGETTQGLSYTRLLDVCDYFEIRDIHTLRHRLHMYRLKKDQEELARKQGEAVVEP